MKHNSQEELILRGNLWRVAWTLSIPAVAAMVLYGLNGIADLVFIGQYCSADAVAGGAIAANFSAFTMGFGSLVGVGMGTVLSLAIGERDGETQKRIIGNLNALSLIIAALLGTLGWFFAEPFMAVMGASGEALRQGLSYYRICLAGIPFIVHGVGLNMVVRAEGKMASAAVMMGTGLIVNILSNGLFMGVFGLGIEGAAWGTNVGMVVYSLAGFAYLHSGRASYPAKPFSLRLDREIAGKAVGNGIPSLIMSVMTLLQAIVIYRVLAGLGDSFDQAFYGVTFRIMNFMLTPIFGLMRALQPVIGINYGAAQTVRVKKAFWTFWLIATLLVLPAWALLMIFPAQAIGTMLPGAALSFGDLTNFRIAMLVIPILPVMFMTMTLYPAIGKGGPVALLGLARQLVLYVPVMLLVPRALGISWIYTGSFLIDLSLTAVVVLMILKEFRRMGQRPTAA